MLKAAIFDFDGTLFDSNYAWETAGARFFQSIGIVPKNNLQQELRSTYACYLPNFRHTEGFWKFASQL